SEPAAQSRIGRPVSPRHERNVPPSPNVEVAPMPATLPATIDAFADLVRKSHLIESTRLDDYWTRLQNGTAPDRPHRLARRMVEDGLLTNFQAEQLLKGKYKGFGLSNYRILERIGRGGM